MKIKVSSVLAGLIFCNSISAVVIKEEEQNFNITALVEEKIIDIMQQASSRYFKPVSL